MPSSKARSQPKKPFPFRFRLPEPDEPTLSDLPVLDLDPLLPIGHRYPTARMTDAELADDIERTLVADLLDRWFPRCVDPDGGFHQRFARDWTREKETDRFVVFQSRVTWVAAKVALAASDPGKPAQLPALAGRRSEFLGYMRHGVAYLRDRFLDHERGGTWWILPLDGRPPVPSAEKFTYGMAFALFALAAAARTEVAVGDPKPEALRLAQNLGEWLDAHLRDPEFGGWFEGCDADGRVRMSVPTPDRPEAALGTQFGLKIQNTHLHVLEAYTELLKADRTPRNRFLVEETMDLFANRMWSWPGALHTVLTRDWLPLPRACSYGHDVEAGFLVLDAAQALGRAEDPLAVAFARSVIHHAIAGALDREHGGLLEHGEAMGHDWGGEKGWWTQVEALNAFAAVARLGGPQSEAVGAALRVQWRWVRECQFDAEHGGLYAWTDADGRPVGSTAKGYPWKALYHEGRALLNAARWLRGGAEDRPALGWPKMGR